MTPSTASLTLVGCSVITRPLFILKTTNLYPRSETVAVNSCEIALLTPRVSAKKAPYYAAPGPPLKRDERHDSPSIKPVVAYSSKNFIGNNIRIEL